MCPTQDMLFLPQNTVVLELNGANDILGIRLLAEVRSAAQNGALQQRVALENVAQASAAVDVQQVGVAKDAADASAAEDAAHANAAEHAQANEAAAPAAPVPAAEDL